MKNNKKFESLAFMLLLRCCVIAILSLPGASSKATFVQVRAHLGRQWPHLSIIFQNPLLENISQAALCIVILATDLPI